MEVLADMDNTLQVSGPLPGHPGKTVLFTHEICNPVSAETYPITLSDTSERVEVSNFVYPSYFDPATGEGEQVDFLGTKCGGKMLKPLGVNPRGYLMYKNSASGDWKLLLAREKACVGRTTSRVLP